MVQHASNVVDFAAYRSRRGALLPQTLPSAILQGVPAFAVPVLLPIMVGWIPMWVVGVAIAKRANNE